MKWALAISYTVVAMTAVGIGFVGVPRETQHPPECKMCHKSSHDGKSAYLTPSDRGTKHLDGRPKGRGDILPNEQRAYIFDTI